MVKKKRVKPEQFNFSISELMYSDFFLTFRLKPQFTHMKLTSKHFFQLDFHVRFVFDPHPCSHAEDTAKKEMAKIQVLKSQVIIRHLRHLQQKRKQNLRKVRIKQKDNRQHHRDHKHQLTQITQQTIKIVLSQHQQLIQI